MAWKGVITNSGSELLAQWTAGKTLTITRAAAGTGRVSEAAMLAQTALVSEKQTVSILSNKTTAQGQKLQLQVTPLATGYPLNQLGIWAKLDSGAARLIALFQTDTDAGVEIPSKTDVPDYVYTFYGLLEFTGSGGTLQVTIDASALVTAESMAAAIKAHNEDENAHEGIRQAITDKQDKITASGILRGDGKGGVTAQKFDTVPTENSDKLLTSGAVAAALAKKAGLGTDGKVPVSQLPVNTPGGVAGLGATLENCHTLVEIEEGSAYLGAVAGDVDADAAVSDNTFTSERLGALDGISYAGHAEPVDFDTLCTTPGVPESFSRLELTFVADGVVVEVVPFQYGEGIDALPEIPAKKGCSASWPDLDYTYLTASQTLEAEYTPYTSALTDGGELPEILVDGSFSSRAQVSHTTEEVAWTDGGAEYAGTAYTVTVEDPDLEQAAYTVHCRLPDPGKRYDLWVLSEDGWTKTDARLDGQYLLLESQTGTVTFCLTERAGPLAVVILAVGFAGLLIGFCWLIRWRRKGTAAGRKH